eukprot:CAMPEP_0184302398 /NCGR_PEP_ID=MMETSP1049-20130417/12388_1 /TAXON_ID=77928 /ORGANISM="Proteomonas sulcata, Strain CCMP704" /LENGTH=216 /DNA_ID=CAMNT_0026613683 /DNA_START=96 /DNA_END=746 /DNA_ORIENTATION=+
MKRSIAQGEHDDRPASGLVGGEIKFDPELPDEKIAAIRRLNLGKVEKLYFEFSEEQWKVLDSLGVPGQWIVPDPEDANILDCSFSFSRGIENRFLIAWVGPEHRVNDVSSRSDDELLESLRSLLQRFTDKKDLVPKALKVKRTSWAQDPFIGGSWSYRPSGSKPEDMDTLSEPLGSELQLLFAGEATHPNYFGTVHGAFFSGVREADRILEHQKKP